MTAFRAVSTSDLSVASAIELSWLRAASIWPIWLVMSVMVSVAPAIESETAMILWCYTVMLYLQGSITTEDFAEVKIIAVVVIFGAVLAIVDFSVLDSSVASVVFICVVSAASVSSVVPAVMVFVTAVFS